MRLRTSLAIAALAVLAVACGDRSEPVEVRSGELALAVSVEPAALRVGRNTMWIEVEDARGEPVPNADVSVRVLMHAMGAMPAMGGPAAVTAMDGGRHRADFELDMGGTWKVQIAVRTPEGPVARAEGSLSVGTSGLRLQGSAPAAGTEPPAATRAAQDQAPGEFRLDPGRLQRVGVRTAVAERKPVASQLRAVGRVVAEETTLEDVALKVRGWVGRVHVDAVGDPVEKGQVLLTVYSPELYAAQEEYLQALRSQARARETQAPERADYLVRAARNRLRLWDIAPGDLATLERRGTALEHLPIRAPVAGYVIEKSVVEGSGFEPGMRLYRIAPLAQVWVEADVYEFELSELREGQSARITLPYLPGRSFEATVDYVYPTLNPATRTARVRLELPNPELELRPGMYVNVALGVDRGERLMVPLSAVLHAGERSFVFRALGEGRFRPQQVTIGLQSGEEVEVLEGLAPGDPVVASGTFLIASESRLRDALEQW